MDNNTRFKIKDCSECNGLCCINPPEVRSLEELKFATQNKAKVLGLKVDTNRYILTIAKEDGACKFLNKENGECSVYENRFEACKLLDCKLISENGITLEEFKNGAIGIKKEYSKPVFFDKKTIKRYKVKIADKDYILKKAFLTDIEDYLNRALPMFGNAKEV